MRRLTTTLGLLGALAVTASLSSCNTVTPDDTAATVNGRTLSLDTLSQMAHGSSDIAVVRSVLTTWIRVNAVSDTPVDVHSQAEMDAKIADLDASMLAAHADEAKADYDKGLDGATFLCLAAIPVDTVADADEVVSKLNRGAALADVAKQYSTSSTLAASGGIVVDSNGQECLDPSSFNTAFGGVYTALVDAKAKVGKAVAVDAGDASEATVVLLLRSFDALSPASQTVVAASSINRALATYYEQAHVEVNDQFGTWDTATASIIAYSVA